MFIENRMALTQLINPNMIVEAIRKHFGAQLKLIDKLVYRKPYLEWVDKMMLLPMGYKVPNLTIFREMMIS